MIDKGRPRRLVSRRLLPHMLDKNEEDTGIDISSSRTFRKPRTMRSKRLSIKRRIW